MNPGSRSYLVINIFIAGMVVVILAYSGIFSPEKNDYPVSCIHEKISGEPCPSCGLSHSFSYLVRGDVSSAAQWNIYGIRVFTFFVLQLLMRLIVSAVIFKTGRHPAWLLKADILVSVPMFIICFRQFIGYYISLLS